MDKDRSKCRLCLKAIYDNNFDSIGALTIQMFEMLLLTLNLDTRVSLVMCPDCATRLKKSFDFKTACISVKDKLSPVVSFRENNKSENENVTDGQMCRFCMKLTESGCFSYLCESKKNMFLVDMLQKHFPELYINTTEELVTCDTCHGSLQNMLSFIRNCLDAEDRINETLRTEGTNDENQIQLESIKQFTFKSELKDFDTCIVESMPSEDKCGESKENMIIKTEAKGEYPTEVNNACIKREEIEIKSEQCVNESVQADIAQVHLEEQPMGHKTPSKVQMYKCKVCTFETRHRGGIRKHAILHKSASEIQIFKCDKCEYEAKHKHALNKHMLVHKDSSEVRMYKCDLCMYETKYRCSLKNHMIIHKDRSETEMYKCDVCVFETKHKKSIRTHMRSHKKKNSSEMRIFKCTMCKYETKQRKALRNHMIIHMESSKIQLYKCNLRKYEANHKNSLKSHIVVHKDSESNLQM